MAEQEAFNQLEIQNRQYYICGLNRRDFQLPARNVFTDMSSANPIFILALKKTGRDFKNWKAVLLNKFCEHAENWAKDQLRRKLGGNELRTVAEIRRAIRDSFDISWIPQLWTVFRGIIDWRSVSDVGYQWLQYVTCHMMAVIRMQKINETFREPGYAKYTREYVLQTYDGLHLRFAGRLSVADFPLTEVPSTTARHASRPFIDPYEDSDGEIEDDFYTDFSNIDRSNLFVWYVQSPLYTCLI
ncbi:hypothetical protein F5882DRAFT_422936 [Hyaloscypha sp. PMI_1271]|nr:hypothetical protein F5882DRAFT_422936 [Hyaloscypha sp. PMI_1271]